ncbi:MAG TPA: hypothetical protein VNU68_35185 [Verrucomicrobiae bacterium]|nr:hypothetical protein [Verrucomicrobiae bacterium]
MKPAILIGILALAGCTLAGCSDTTNAKIDRAIVQGQLFCARASAAGSLVVALADAAGAPISVTGRSAASVAAACAAVGAIPVSPPPNPSQAPVVAAPIAATPAPKS